MSLARVKVVTCTELAVRTILIQRRVCIEAAATLRTSLVTGVIFRERDKNRSCTMRAECGPCASNHRHWHSHRIVNRDLLTTSGSREIQDWCQPYRLANEDNRVTSGRTSWRIPAYHISAKPSTSPLCDSMAICLISPHVGIVHHLCRGEAPVRATERECASKAFVHFVTWYRSHTSCP